MQLPVSIPQALLALISLPALVATNTCSNDHSLIVTDTAGRTYAGFTKTKTVRAFLGIPYVEPPLGSLRWKPPQALDPAPPTAKRMDASKFGKSCYQFRHKTFTIDELRGEEWVRFNDVGSEQGEDCLTLNVWAPVQMDRKEKLLPVMVWIHGGKVEVVILVG